MSAPQARRLEILPDRHIAVARAGDDARTCPNSARPRRNPYDREQRLVHKVQPVSWIAADAFPWLDWQQVLADEEALSALFATLHDQGFTWPKDAPTEDGETGRLGALRATDFGTAADIHRYPPAQTGRHAHIVADGAAGLAPHTDEGWRHALPGTNFHLSPKTARRIGAVRRSAGRHRVVGKRQAFDLLCRLPFRFVAECSPRERYRTCGRPVVTDRDGEIVGARRHVRQCSVDRVEFHNSCRRLAERPGRMDDAATILPGGALG